MGPIWDPQIVRIKNLYIKLSSAMRVISLKQYDLLNFTKLNDLLKEFAFSY